MGEPKRIDKGTVKWAVAGGTGAVVAGAALVNTVDAETIWVGLASGTVVTGGAITAAVLATRRVGRYLNERQRDLGKLSLEPLKTIVEEHLKVSQYDSEIKSIEDSAEIARERQEKYAARAVNVPEAEWRYLDRTARKATKRHKRWSDTGVILTEQLSRARRDKARSVERIDDARKSAAALPQDRLPQTRWGRRRVGELPGDGGETAAGKQREL